MSSISYQVVAYGTDGKKWIIGTYAHAQAWQISQEILLDNYPPLHGIEFNAVVVKKIFN